MRFSLAINALSSLSIAIEKFKSFYYNNKILQSEFEEYVKIGIVFLENSVELMLKTILSTENELIIFKDQNCKAIKDAKKYVNENNSLYDVLISKRVDVYTITYADTVKLYNEKFHNSKKLKSILDTLGVYRNRFTHFGIEFASYDEILCIFINAFDIIYNYLYPELIKLDEIGDYFTSDDIVVETIHGSKPLINENMIYNNIVDFFDELLCDDNDFLFLLCYKNPDKNITAFEEFFSNAINDKRMSYLLNKYSVVLIPDESSDYKNGYDFNFMITKESDEINVLFRYLPYYNAIIYEDDVGVLLFIVLFENNQIYIYDKYAKYPEFYEPDIDNQWEKDLKKGLCQKYVLSKNNIIKAIETTILREFGPKRV